MNPTVLVADDDVNFQIIADTLLTLRDFRVRVAGDAAEAEVLLRQEPVAVVVVDLGLAGMNGFELLRRLNGRGGTQPLPNRPRTLVLTTRAEPEVERFALRLGAHAVLHKPLAPAVFIQTVEELSGSATPQAA
ncbi:MAG: response regulator [Deltaproteobacteria bacterium]|nr:response regulator [Deltaproteobacteria bacterium]